MTQHPRREASQHVHRHGEPLAQKQRRQRDQDAAQSAGQAPGNHANQDRADESNISSQEVVHPAAHQHPQRDGRTDDQHDF